MKTEMAGSRKRRDMADFPEDAVIEIFTCLPVKSLLRFRCISKHFLSLIDDPDFIKRHLDHSIRTKSNHKLILGGQPYMPKGRSTNAHLVYSVDLDKLDQTLELDHPLRSREYEVEVLGSANGLLCLYNAETIVIWNLATRKYRKLPGAEIERPKYTSFSQHVVYGFGYDSVSDDYKLLRLVHFSSRGSFTSEAKVYNMRSNSWQRIQDFPYKIRYRMKKNQDFPLFRRYMRGYSELVCGALHWIGEVDGVEVIIAFDLATNKYRLVDQPLFPKKGFHITVKELDGRLCLMCDLVNEQVDMWMMKNYGVRDSWTKLFSISQPNAIHPFEFSPLAYSKVGDKILMVQDIKNLIWYHLKEQKVEMINLPRCPDYFESVVYVESLVTFNGKAGNYAKKNDAKSMAEDLIKGSKCQE